IVAGFDQMRGEAMPQRVCAERFHDAGTPASGFQCARDDGVIEVMTPKYSVARIARKALGSENILPADVTPRIRVFAGERMRQPHRRASRCRIARVTHACPVDLAAQWLAKGLRQHRAAVLGALAVAHHDLVAGEIDVFDAQAQAFHETHARAVQKTRYEPSAAVHRAEKLPDFVPRKHGRNSPRTLRAYDAIHPRQLDAEHVAVQE